MAPVRTIPTSQIPDLITYTILIDGEEIPTAYHIKSISVNREVNKIPFARIVVLDGDPASEDFPISNEEYFVPGKEIEIQFGYRSDNISVFQGIITAHSNKISASSSELVIECKDKAVKLTVGKKNKHFEEVTDSDIAEEIIDTYGLEKDIESTNITHKEAIQFNTTDWDFIISRMDTLGRFCTIEDGKITIKKPDLTAESAIDVLYGATILDYQAEIDSRYQHGEVTSKSWDYSGQEILVETGDEPSMNEAGNLSSSDLSEVIGLDNYLLSHGGKIDATFLKDWANAKLLKSRLSKIKGHVKFQGFPDIKPGNMIFLHGVGDRFNGPVYVSATTHTYSNGNWTTEVKLGMSKEWFAEVINPYHLSAQWGQFPSVQGLQIGKVTDLEDPDGENRVKVRLPIISPDEEGLWMRIATLDAGNARGTFFMPEVDDEVIVGFIYNDPNQPVILGMLHSSALTPPLTASNDNHEKGYVSREGIKMIFNDDEKSYKLETPGGKKITLNDNDGTVVVEDENGNSINMSSDGVTIESATALTLKAGTDITLEAINIMLSPSSQFSLSAGGSEMTASSGNLEIKGATVKVEGSGMTEIKGGLVQIN